MKRIAYMLDLFPVTSETFIVREIMELQKQGLDISIFPLKDATGSVYSQVVHKESQGPIAKSASPVIAMGNHAPDFAFLFAFEMFISAPAQVFKNLSNGMAPERDDFRLVQKGCNLFSCIQADGYFSYPCALFAWKRAKWPCFVTILSGISYSFTIHAHDIFIEDGVTCLKRNSGTPSSWQAYRNSTSSLSWNDTRH